MKHFNTLPVLVWLVAIGCEAVPTETLMLDPDAGGRDAAVLDDLIDEIGEADPIPDAGPQASWDARIVDAANPGDEADDLSNPVAGDAPDAAPVEPEAPTCEQACRHMMACNHSPSDAIYACVDDCRAADDAAQRRCILDAECDALDACGGDAPVAPPPEPLGGPDCRATCGSLADCGLVLPADLSDCVDGCDADSTAAERQCLVDAGCDLGQLDACFSTPADPGPPDGASDCLSVCDSLLDCDFIYGFEYGDCVDSCEVDLTAADRTCLTAARCDFDRAQACLDAAADPEPPAGGAVPDCQDTCGTFVDCGFIGRRDLADCVDGCEFESTRQERRCLAQAGCDADLADACFF